MRNTLHIRAVGDLLAPYLDDAGRPVPGRYAGRHRKTREALPEGETAIDHPDAQRASRPGPPPPAAPEPIAPAPAPAAKEISK